MILRISIYISLATLLMGCLKGADCISDDTVPQSPYSNPVWYPDGSFLGFNHNPLMSVTTYGAPGCSPEYSVSFYDSTGFWVINKDGTNMRRVTSFSLEDPSWSPDGRWIAFDNGGAIHKMAFDGNNFDTAHILQVTPQANNYFPCWSPQSDTIYFDSDLATYFHIYKMAADGSGQAIIGNKGIDSLINSEPFCNSNNQLVNLGGIKGSQFLQIFTMDFNGANVTQVTSDSDNVKQYPKWFNNRIYFEANGIWSVNMDGSGLKEICGNSNLNYSISKSGTIAFVNFDGSKVDQTNGVIWLVDTSGKNKIQLTANKY
jgi:hypothetical protein